jgi:GTP-binding protein Era
LNVTKSGIVTVVGKPNVGKSTLLNRLVGTKLSIVSPKPQSTRDRVVGIRTADDIQMVILDTPGLLDPKYELQRVMRSTALEALRDADVIVYVTDATDGEPADFAAATQLSKAPAAPILVALNKSDRLKAAERKKLAAAQPDALFISASKGEGVEELTRRIAAMLPESAFLYPEDEISTQNLRFFVSELVRETALEQLSEELPYSIACEIEEFREEKTPLYIRAVMYVERESQKRILIGAKGQQIRSIGQKARVKIEAFVEQKVYLDLWVKVLPNWRKSNSALARFGYRVQEQPKR